MIGIVLSEQLAERTIAAAANDPPTTEGSESRLRGFEAERIAWPDYVFSKEEDSDE